MAVAGVVTLMTALLAVVLVPQSASAHGAMMVPGSRTFFCWQDGLSPQGNIVPINTPVKLVSMSGSKLTLKRLDTGQELKVENENKFTKKSIPEIAALMLSIEKTPIEKLPEEVASAVRNGEMRKGMTRELVLLARGHPPAHETPSLENDRWVYWSSRFVKQTIVFINGRLSEGRGLY